MTKQEKVALVLDRLFSVWPEPKTELLYTTPFELLVAVILSAQATDKLVNTVTPYLFAAYKTLNDYANASAESIDVLINKVNYHHAKARYIKGAAEKIIKDFNGELPQTIDELVALPGVGRKTANVIVSEIFHKNEGITVDTHVKRLSNCLGLTTNTDPVKIEQDLMKIVPQEHWRNFSHLLILFGRYQCPARMDCHECPYLGDLMV